MPLFKRKPKAPAPAPPPMGQVQLRQGESHPFQMLSGYTPLHSPEFSLYRAIREAIPVVDAAILKLIRLTGGLTVACPNKRAEKQLNDFLKTVNTGWNQQGIQSFLDGYLDALLTCGRAVGEIVLDSQRGGIAAVLCGNVSDIQVKEDGSPLNFQLGLKGKNGEVQPLPYQELLLFTPYHPSAESPYGVSLLRAMPFLSNILLKIYQTLGLNWERAGNVRFSVVYKPTGEGLEPSRAQERSRQLAAEWSSAMQSSRGGAVRDFVSVGDVDIRVIGAEADIPDCQVPIRLIVEQLIAQTGLPPFMLGLNWSSTERMSSQQADVMTSELTALRRILSPTLEKICRLWLQLKGFEPDFELVWEDINLQDQVEEARALLYRQQARKLELENERAEKGEEEQVQKPPPIPPPEKQDETKLEEGEKT